MNAYSTIKISHLLAWVICFAPACTGTQGPQPVDHLQGEMAGEVTASSVILQSRLTAPAIDETGDAPGRAGIALFELSTNPNFTAPIRSSWLQAQAASDFIVKTKIEGLQAGTLYYYRLIYGVDQEHAEVGPSRSFRTLPGADAEAPTRFLVVTGMHYARFRQSDRGKEPDAPLGFPALISMRLRNPDFVVYTGDNVYYDHAPEIKTVPEMRKKWHEQFLQKRFVDLFAEVPGYWEKDDHDHRYNDSDTTDTPVRADRLQLRPTHSEGVRVFREQVPVVDLADLDAVTYRTHRVSQDLQIWLLEGRDYRSPNRAPDGPRKTIWGETQRTWLKETLLASDATFKLIISPTPMVGPDDAYKIDNHTNPNGFLTEGNAFFAWAEEEGFLNKGLYLICGDRHWQYHSMHPAGFEEFSSGALVDGNARLGRVPGDSASTDPYGHIFQPYTSPEASGGFLEVNVTPGLPATLTFTFRDEGGVELYSAQKTAPAAPLASR